MREDAIQAAARELQAKQEAFNAAINTGGVQGLSWSHDVVMQLSFSVLGLATVAIITAAILFWRSHADPGHVLRMFGIIFIVALSTVLVIVGYSNEQLTPVVGLFGAIAGYLLGRDASRAPCTVSHQQRQ